MKQRALHWFSLADVTLLPAFIMWFIWRLQFVAPRTWMLFAVWLAVSFILHRDTPKTLGWRTDNLWDATKQALVVFSVATAAILVAGLMFDAPRQLTSGPISARHVGAYFAFCIVQQVALNSLVHNRMLSLVSNEWAAAAATGAIFAACHWPNPVLVPLTFGGGAVMAWMFGRVRNIIPLAMGQAVMGLLMGWAFPETWHHHMRVGPGYYNSSK